MKHPDNDFNKVSRRQAAKHPPPFSLRLTFEERAKLEREADGMPLGAFIRARLFAQDLPAVRRRGRHSVRDHAELARVLAVLGQSRLANNLNQLSKAANTGSLPLTPEVEAELREACAAVQEMRGALIAALGLGGGAS